jgi:hypothetical protein
LYAKDGSVSTTKQKNKGGGRSHTQNASLAAGSTDTLSVGTTTTGTKSDSLAKGNAKSRSISKSIQQQITKEDVLEPNQIFEAVASELDRDDPRFPGQALILMRGNRNFLVRTVRYYEDEAFYRRYSAHPDFGMQQAPLPYSLRMELKYDAEKAAKILKERKQQLRKEFFHRAKEMARQMHVTYEKLYENTVFHLELDLTDTLYWQDGVPSEQKGVIEDSNDPTCILKLKTGHPVLSCPSTSSSYEVVELNTLRARIKVTGLKNFHYSWQPDMLDDIEPEDLIGFSKLPECESWSDYEHEWQAILNSSLQYTHNLPSYLVEDMSHKMKEPYRRLEWKMENASTEWQTTMEALRYRKILEIADRKNLSTTKDEPHIWLSYLVWWIGLWIGPLMTAIVIFAGLCGLFDFFTNPKSDIPFSEFVNMFFAFMLFGCYSGWSWAHLMETVENEFKELPLHPLLEDSIKDQTT